jgi:hypothetical protein
MHILDILLRLLVVGTKVFGRLELAFFNGPYKLGCLLSPIIEAEVAQANNRQRKRSRIFHQFIWGLFPQVGEWLPW